MIKVYLNRKVSETQITIGNQYESGVNAIAFDLSELKEKWPNGNIYLLVSRKAHTWPYSIDDGEFKIEYVLTWKRGFYQMNVVVTDEKITDQLESSNTIFVSDTINAYVNENQINAKALNEQELPRELQIVYDDLITLKKNIEKDLADGKYIGPQGPKGEPGDVTEEYRNLASQIAQNASDAQTSATNAQVSATNAQKSLDDTKDFVNQTKTELNQIKTDTRALKDEANTSAVNAQASATSAQESATNASQSATSAQESSTNAQVSATNAQKILDDTKTFANQAISEVNQIKTDTNTLKDEANTSAVNAKSSEDKAKEYADNLQASTDDISKLKEDLAEVKDKKITKFYASNQGETHLADSDNGKIQDMVVYGKSSQNKTTGKNLLKIKDATQTTRGVTITSKDGIITVNGTATETGWAYLNIDKQIFADGTYIASYESNDNNNKPRLLLANAAGNKVIEQNEATALSNAEIAKVCFVIAKGNTYNMTGAKVQLELGSKATSYEPYTGGIPSPNPYYPQEIKSVVNPTVKITNEDGLKVQSVTLNNITLNAIPVSSGGNVTIDGQQYIADYIDVERGKLYRKVKRLNLKDVDSSNISHGLHSNGNEYLSINILNGKANGIAISNQYKSTSWTMENGCVYIPNDKSIVFVDDRFTDKPTAIGLIKDTYVIYELQAQVEEDLTSEQVETLKMLSTYYPITNISVNSEQLDGYTVFNYPISLANGWNYVKKQLNDNRDYIYDMDLQSAEAFVNSEYAVALTELGV